MFRNIFLKRNWSINQCLNQSFRFYPYIEFLFSMNLLAMSQMNSKFFFNNIFSLTTVHCWSLPLNLLKKIEINVRFPNRVSKIIDYSLKRNNMQLHEIIFISCIFAGLHEIGETSISRSYGVILHNFYKVIS